MLWRWLTGLILLVMASTAQATPNYNGYHNVADCSSISGWAWDANKRTQPINVDIYDGSTLISTLPAATFDQGLLNWGFGDGRHAFSIATPASLLDGKWHLITVKYGGTQTALNNSPRAINACTAAAQAKVYYIHADQLDTPRVITDTAGNVVWQWDNVDPFGNNMANENPAGAGAYTFNLRFPGQYFDKETNTHYNYFRDYDPATGRYVESDLIGLWGGINTYTYVNGNPLRWDDPLGLRPPSVVPTVIGTSAAQQNALVAQNISNPHQFYELVKNNGAWDYKQYGRDLQNFGNYNFGVVAAATGLFNLQTILQQAGRAQCTAGTSNPNWGDPKNGPPYGDDPTDQSWITEGWNDYQTGMYGNPRSPRAFGLAPAAASFYSNNIQTPLLYCSSNTQCW